MKPKPRWVSIALRSYTICLLLVSAGFCSFAQLSVDYGKSFVNVTKGTNGGTIEPGDTLEIRATFVVKGSGVNDYVDSCAFFDAIPANTAYIPGTLAILTNEGKVYKNFTDAAGDDAGWIVGNNVQINMGFKNAPTATAFRRGRVKFNDKPSFFGASCIMVASYRVRVTAAYGTAINIGGGKITYLPFGGSLSAINFNRDSIMVFKNLGICSNTAGNNAIISEFGGTFGSGYFKNRVPSTRVPANYTYATFSANMPNDYYYGVSNNTSVGGAGYTALNTWPIPDAAGHRVFQVWDIIGDHTGALNQLLGNPATDTTKNPGGYMVVINSSYKTDTAFLDTVKNLCPNTYYQYNAWFRNICSKCACDSNGKGPSTAGFVPTGPGDSSGVHPNMTFSINGYDYYTTGNLLYTGQWILKGFTYLTGPAQTSMIINIRNNAPGGGGNDWAIDDIGIASCAPNITLTPNKPDTLCQGADDTVRFKVSAFFNNVTEWMLQQSTDNGVTWNSPGLDTLGQAASGNATAVYNPVSGLYEYLITRYYRLSFLYPTVLYRLTIATTVGNLSNINCSYIASNNKVIVAVNCNVVLPTSIDFSGKVQEGFAKLQWVSYNETGNTLYVVERSLDGKNFQPLGTLQGTAGPGQGASYHYTDPQEVNGKAYYRVTITDNSLQKLSKVVLLSNSTIDLDMQGLVNPFLDKVSFNLTVPHDGTALMAIYDIYGRAIREERQPVSAGINSLQILGFGGLATGAYVLRVQYGDEFISRKMLKTQK
jgi:hypothetical protein